MYVVNTVMIFRGYVLTQYYWALNKFPFGGEMVWCLCFVWGGFRVAEVEKPDPEDADDGRPFCMGLRKVMKNDERNLPWDGIVVWCGGAKDVETMDAKVKQL